MESAEHQPVMVAEVLEALKPHPDGRYCDGTVGLGGHAAAILQASAPTGWLYGCDQDAGALAIARERLAPFADRCELRHANFAELAEWAPAGRCDGVLLDLGMSSWQLEAADGERGLSFRHDAELDMRLDRRRTLTAAQLVNEAEPAELARLFRGLGDEPAAGRIARAIARARQQGPITRTSQLAELVARVAPRAGRANRPATRVFMALRRAVNDEVGALARGLPAAWRVLRVGGRLAVLSFSSGEHRAVRAFGRALARPYTFPGPHDVPELRRACVPQLRWVRRKALTPSLAEVRANRRARSAQLWIMEKVAAEEPVSA